MTLKKKVKILKELSILLQPLRPASRYGSHKVLLKDFTDLENLDEVKINHVYFQIKQYALKSDKAINAFWEKVNKINKDWPL